MPQNDNITIVVPDGAIPSEDLIGQLIQVGIRLVAVKCVSQEDEWPEKYGANFENGVFSMRQYCWCEKEDCAWCREIDRAPNFLHKPSGLAVTWYKYIGRGMEINSPSRQYFSDNPEVVLGIFEKCLKSI